MSGMKLLSSPLPEVALVDMPSTITRWSPCTAAVDGERAQVEIVRSAVVRGPAHPGNQHGEIRVVPPGGNRIEDLLVQDALLRHALDVDDRRFPVTVIVSSTAPTRRSAFTVAVNDPPARCRRV